jgi:hypothetical protein
VNRAIVLTALVLATAAATILAAGASQPHDERAAEFQRLVGGLGMGAASDPSRCEAAFDPRLCPHCSHDLTPMPGGAIFCRHDSE